MAHARFIMATLGYKHTQYSRFQTFTVILILYMLFWVFPWRQILGDRRFGILCQFHLQRLDVDCEVCQAKVLTGGGDLREAQVDVPLSVSHSCV